MKSGTRYNNEKCKCIFCNTTFDSDDVFNLDSWNCPTCGQYIHIEIPSKQLTVIRKRISDVDKNDLILLDGENTGKKIFDIQPFTNNRTYLAVKEFGHTYVDNNDYLNIVIGGC